MNIVEYCEKYNEEIVELVLDIENNEAKINLSLEEQPDLMDIQGTFINNEGNFWVAIDKEEVIGTIGLVIKENHCGVLKKFFVRADWRSKKLGLALYKTLLEYAKSKELESLILDTPSVAKAAHRFYECAGFHKVSARQLPVSYEYPDRDCDLYMLTL